MNYSVTSREVTIDADEFVSRYRDVERIAALCEQCPSFGKMWCCPPYSFDPRTLSDGFTTVKLIGTTIEFDEETCAACMTPEESSAVGREAMEQVWKSILPRMYELERQMPGSRCFTFRCSLCPEGCTRPEGKPCRHPDMMRHSLESVGFDIEAMTRDQLGIELEWSSDGSLPSHITIVTALMQP